MQLVSGVDASASVHDRESPKRSTTLCPKKEHNRVPKGWVSEMILKVIWWPAINHAVAAMLAIEAQLKTIYWTHWLHWIVSSVTPVQYSSWSVQQLKCPHVSLIPSQFPALELALSFNFGFDSNWNSNAQSHGYGMGSWWNSSLAALDFGFTHNWLQYLILRWILVELNQTHIFFNHMPRSNQWRVQESFSNFLSPRKPWPYVAFLKL